MVGTSHAMPVEFYNGWSGGDIMLTNPIKGIKLTGASDGDKYC